MLAVTQAGSGRSRSGSKTRRSSGRHRTSSKTRRSSNRHKSSQVKQKNHDDSTCVQEPSHLSNGLNWIRSLFAKSNQEAKPLTTNSQVTPPMPFQSLSNSSLKPSCTTLYALRTQDLNDTLTASCPICYETIPISNMFIGQQCTHDYGDAICNPCATSYIRGLIANGKTDFKCVAKGCKTSFSIDDLKKLLTYNEIIALDRGAK